jgi:CheY-like chemotaxis protein
MVQIVSRFNRIPYYCWLRTGSAKLEDMPGRRRLLIVDDEEALQRLARRHAERADFDVLVAGTVAEALDLAVSGAPTAILLDLSLPDGSGIDALGRLKNDPRTAEIPVVVWSGSDVVEAGERASAAGAVAYFEKNEIKQILAKLADLVG